MQDKKLLELLENFVIKLDNGELNEYIWNNYICQGDLRRTALVLSKGDFWDCIDTTKTIDIIENIDNFDFLNDENNLYWKGDCNERKNK